MIADSSRVPQIPQVQVLHVKPRLPARLEKLREIAYNLRWAWNENSVELFRRLDRELWETVGHNPVRLLGNVDQGRLERAAQDPAFLSHLDSAYESLREYQTAEAWFQHRHPEFQSRRVAYFSAEFGLTECLPIYSGGLGVLAGDHLKSASELGIPLVGVGLAYQEGYFNQYLSADGWQQEVYREIDFFNMPISLERDAAGAPILIRVRFPGRDVAARIWRADVGRVRLYLMDANVAENSPEDRGITRRLYGGSAETRIQQEILLGIGGLRALRAVGVKPDVFHMNEGHAAFLGAERTREIIAETGLNYEAARQLTASSSIFTTHTPVPAGFDLFDAALMQRYFAEYVGDLGIDFNAFMTLGRIDATSTDQPFNMALFAVRHSTYRNGVSRLHGQVTRRMMHPWWPGYPENEVPVESVTNGVHMRTWISQDMQEVLRRYLGPFWSADPTDHSVWRQLDQAPDEEVWRTHMICKQRLVRFARQRLQQQCRHRGGSPEELDAARRVLEPDRLTIGFARRFVTYKRATLLLRDLERLTRLITDARMPVQFVFAGKAHPADTMGKEIIKAIVHFAARPDVRHSVVFIEDYDINVARHLVQGVDVWLNTPRRPLEASGTSGMKAAANGVLNVSVLDGWWDEGYESDVGWAIGSGEQYENDEYQDRIEANALYDLLEREVAPLYYQRGADGLPTGWIAKMRATMKRLCPRFNTNRMVSEYTDRFYMPSARRSLTLRTGNLDRVLSLVDWTRRVEEHWGSVQVTEVRSENGTELHVGAHVPIRVGVRLGALKPEDVSVEVYHGTADAERRMREGTVTPLRCVGQDGGVYRYEGMLDCPVAGLYGFAVRIRPSHPDALIPNDLALITWF